MLVISDSSYKNIIYELCSSCLFCFMQDAAREILKNAPGVVIIDDRAANQFPTPLKVSNKDDIAVGRIRRDVSLEGNKGYVRLTCLSIVLCLFPVRRIKMKPMGFFLCMQVGYLCLWRSNSQGCCT